MLFIPAVYHDKSLDKLTEDLLEVLPTDSYAMHR